MRTPLKTARYRGNAIVGRLAVSYRLNLKHGDCVLDVGCGTGRNFPFLREAIGPTGRIYGVDLSAGMLRNARKLRDRHHWTNIHLTEGDAANYVAPEPLDGVLFSLSYNTMPHHTQSSIATLLAPRVEHQRRVVRYLGRTACNRGKRHDYR